MHRTTIVKVNAAVDCKVAPVVEALSLFPELTTTESCENTADGRMTVFFGYGKGWPWKWKPLAQFVCCSLGPWIAAKVGVAAATVSLEITGCGWPQGILTVEPAAAVQVAAAIRRLAKNYKPAR